MPSLVLAALQALALFGAATTAQAKLADEMPEKTKSCGGKCAPTWRRCNDNGKYSPCCFPGDVCLEKDGRFGRCQPGDSKEPAKWPTCHKIVCKGSVRGKSSDDDDDDEEDDDGAVPGIEPSKNDKNGDGENDSSPFDIGTDPKDGSGSCPASGRDHCSRATKCCASSRMRNTNCCQNGTQCVRKNKFYAACMPEDRRKINIGRGWEGSIMKCGQDVGDGL